MGTCESRISRSLTAGQLAGTRLSAGVLEEDAWLVSGTISGHAKVGAISIIVNTTVTDYAQVYGVMWAVNGKKLSGTAQLRGDLENNFTKELTKGVFYGMVDDGMLNNANYGANLTTPPTDATASIENAQWYTVADDSTSVGPGDDSTTVNPVLTGKRGVDSQKPRLYFDSKEQAVFVRVKKNGREYRYRVSGTRNR